MRFPIKVNQSIVPRWLVPFVPTVHDPKSLIFGSEDPRLFDAGIGSIKIDSIWKTTCAGRHPRTDAAICENCADHGRGHRARCGLLVRAHLG